MMNNFYPCEVEGGSCPFDAEYSNACQEYCGLGRHGNYDNDCEYMEEDC